MKKAEKSGWVFCNDENSLLYGATGYILDLGLVSANVHFVLSDDGQALDRFLVMEYTKLIPATVKPPMNKEAFDAFMDLALQTRDYEWAKKLVQEYEQEKALPY